MDRVIDRMTPGERRGVLLVKLPKPVIEHYLGSLPPEETCPTLRLLERYSQPPHKPCCLEEVGERLLERVAMDILARLSDDVPDLVAQLAFNPAPPPEPNPEADQAFHLLAQHIGQEVDGDDRYLCPLPKTSS